MKIILFIHFIFIYFNIAKCQSLAPNSEQTKAIEYLNLNLNIQQSNFWVNVKPALFIKNLRKNILQPLHIYAGSNTNFCAYGALSYTCINTDPVAYVKFMMSLYINGIADYRKVHFNPSSKVKYAAGSLKFKGELDVNEADQIWFLSLADRFKGYLNYLSYNYKTGAENSLWPATNFAKFNRMLRKLTNCNVEAIGSDLIRPIFFDITFFLQRKLKENDQVFIFLNNAIMHKKNHQKVKFRFPTHYVVLFSIEEMNNTITIIFWDYGLKNKLVLPKNIFTDIVFGVTWCKNKSNDEFTLTK